MLGILSITVLQYVTAEKDQRPPIARMNAAEIEDALHVSLYSPECVNTILILESCSIAPSFGILISTSLAPILPPHPLHLRFSQSSSLLHPLSTPFLQRSTSPVHQVCSLTSISFTYS